MEDVASTTPQEVLQSLQAIVNSVELQENK